MFSTFSPSAARLGCASHNLNLEIESCADNDDNLDVFDSVHETMAHCRLGLKNTPMLRNLDALSPIIENKKR